MMESVNPNMKAGVSAVYTLFMQELHPFGVFGASTAPPRPPPPRHAENRMRQNNEGGERGGQPLHHLHFPKAHRDFSQGKEGAGT